MEREEVESQRRRCCTSRRTEPTSRCMAIGQNRVYLSWTEQDGSSSYSANSDRRVQKTNHKTLFVRGSVRLEL